MGRGVGRRPVAPSNQVRIMLAAHAVGLPACAVIAHRVRRLVAATRERGREHGLMVDADSGQQAGRLLVGEEKSVDLAPILRLIRADREYVVVHSHTSDGPFSDADPLLLFLKPRVRAIVVVGARGTVYAMSRLPWWERPSFDALLQAYADEFAALAAETAETIAGGTMPRWRAECERVHRVWLRIGEPFGLLYTRSEVERRWTSRKRHTAARSG